MDLITSTNMIGGNPHNPRSCTDYYPTPPSVTKALINFLNIPKGNIIWEPACGEGDMCEVFKRDGYKVFASDIRYTGYGNGKTDFLTCESGVNFDWIITNPPFSMSSQFIEKCASFKKPFALLLKSQYWHAQKRYDLFMSHRPSYVLPLAFRADFNFKKPGNHKPLMDVIWVVWDHTDSESTQYIPLRKPTIKE